MWPKNQPNWCRGIFAGGSLMIGIALVYAGIAISIVAWHETTRDLMHTGSLTTVDSWSATNLLYLSIGAILLPLSGACLIWIGIRELRGGRPGNHDGS